jgi:hypothetical protein
MLKSPPSTLLELQAARFPLSNPSVKIRSPVLAVTLGLGVNVLVAIGVNVLVGVYVAVGPIAVAVEVGVFVRVAVGVREGPPLGVLVGVNVGPGPPLVAVKVGVGPPGLRIAFRAAATSAMPLPHVEVVQLLPTGKARAVFWRI